MKRAFLMTVFMALTSTMVMASSDCDPSGVDSATAGKSTGSSEKIDAKDQFEKKK